MTSLTFWGPFSHFLGLKLYQTLIISVNEPVNDAFNVKMLDFRWSWWIFRGLFCFFWGHLIPVLSFDFIPQQQWLLIKMFTLMTSEVSARHIRSEIDRWADGGGRDTWFDALFDAWSWTLSIWTFFSEWNAFWIFFFFFFFWFCWIHLKKKITNVDIFSVLREGFPFNFSTWR